MKVLSHDISPNLAGGLRFSRPRNNVDWRLCLVTFDSPDAPVLLEISMTELSDPVPKNCGTVLHPLLVAQLALTKLISDNLKLISDDLKTTLRCRFQSESPGTIKKIEGYALASDRWRALNYRQTTEVGTDLTFPTYVPKHSGDNVRCAVQFTLKIAVTLTYLSDSLLDSERSE